MSAGYQSDYVQSIPNQPSVLPSYFTPNLAGETKTSKYKRRLSRGPGTTRVDLIQPWMAGDDECSKLTPQRSSIMSFLRERFFGSAMGITTGLKRFSVGSCPNLPQTTERNALATKTHQDLLPSGKPVKAVIPVQQVQNANQLTVPDLFVTSQTHSTKLELKIQSTSSPDLGNSKPNRPSMRKSISLSLSPYELIQRESKCFYRDSDISQVLDFLFIGNISSAYNPHLLCRLRIERMVDISNLRPQDVPNNKKSLCSCPCRSDVKHSRAKLNINVEENGSGEIGHYFREINKFIESARVSKKNVLVHSYDGINRSACVVTEYLMTYYDMDLKTALRWVQKCRPSVYISKGCISALEAWEIRCSPTAHYPTNHTPVPETAGINRKSAWTAC